MKVEVAVLGSPSLIVQRVSVDVKQHWTWNKIFPFNISIWPLLTVGWKMSLEKVSSFNTPHRRVYTLHAAPLNLSFQSPRYTHKYKITHNHVNTWGVGYSKTKKENRSRVQQTEHPLPTPQADTRIIRIICVCVSNCIWSHSPPPPLKGWEDEQVFQPLKTSPTRAGRTNKIVQSLKTSLVRGERTNKIFQLLKTSPTRAARTN